MKETKVPIRGELKYKTNGYIITSSPRQQALLLLLAELKPRVLPEVINQLRVKVILQ